MTYNLIVNAYESKSSISVFHI